MNRFVRVVEALEARGVFPDRAPSLEPMRRALRAARLDGEIDPERVIVVAGTNGKGSTCAFLEVLLRGVGQCIGLYTSPHLIRTNERIRIDGEDICEAKFCDLYDACLPGIESESLSHFEALTLMAVRAFAEARTDWMIFEAGLGGLWDATNAIPHRHCVLTPIDFDHQNLLGRTLPEIARNKFGIIGAGASVTYAPLATELEALQMETIARTASRWRERRPFGYEVLAQENGEPRFEIQCAGARAELPMPGRRAAENAALALSVFEGLGFNPSEGAASLAKTRWRGRMERIEWPESRCPVYLSGDHNPHGVRSLLEIIRHYPASNWHVLAGIGRDKDASEMLELLRSIPNAKLYLTETPFKGLRLEEYGILTHSVDGAWSDPVEALTQVACVRAGRGDRILVTGSLYLVGRILEART